MKTTIQINGKDVEITLTPQQVAEIKRKTTDYRDIKTVEDAYAFLGIDYQEWLEKHKDLEPNVIAYMQLTYIVKALNGGEWMNYDDTNEYKYYPYFAASGSGSGFSCVGYYYVCSNSGVGSRLTLKTSERAIYAGKQFLPIYNQYINT
jgi:hypothetical protein